MVTNYTVTGYTPVDSTLYTTPVQVTGHTVHNLTVARTPEGHAIFGWSSGGVYYCAVNADFDDVYRNDVVPDGNERVVFDNEVEGWSVIVGSLWVDRGELFCALSMSFSPAPAVSSGYSICFVADDVENPVTWTQRGIISSWAGTEAVTDIVMAGPPLILTTGTWVMPFATWGAHGGPGGYADRSSIVMSEDRGIDWTVRYSHRQAPGLGGTTGPISDTIGQDPLTGYLWWSHYWGPLADQGYILRSTDSGASWTIIDGTASTTWNFMVDNGVDLLYATAPGVGQWPIYSTDGDPADEAGFIDQSARAIPSNQGNTNFQSIVFLAHGSIAFIDENRIAGYFFPPQGNCPIPDPLHIPYKDRLLKLEVDDAGKPNPASYDLMSDHDFDNLKEIERWAANWMTDSQTIKGAPDSCELFIPYKDHLRHAGPGARKLSPAVQRAISSMSFENYKVIERWAARVTSGECACEGPSKCRLHIPWKDAALAITATDDGQLTGPLESAGQRDFDNYKTIERWANMNARGECGEGEGFPPTPFPDPPNSPVRFSGEMMEVSTTDSADVRFPGEMMEVSTQEAAAVRFPGEMIEVSTQEDTSVLFPGEMIEVAITV